MISLYLSDILLRNKLDPKRTKLIRHSLKQARCKVCYENGWLEEYQKIQNQSFFTNCDYVLSFIGESGTSAKFLGCYKVAGGIPVSRCTIPKGFPVPEMYQEENNFYNPLEPVELLDDLKNRLIINWGKATVAWHQWATNDKAILAIQQSPKFLFGGYEQVVLTYGELKEIIEDKTLYENWHTALSSVYAIYLIVDTINGKQYIGSAYGIDGLLGRWRCYIDTGHGNNEGMKEALCNCADRYKYFKFSILQILPKTITNDGVIEIETLYKRKLLTKEFGMNWN